MNEIGQRLRRQKEVLRDEVARLQRELFIARDGLNDCKQDVARLRSELEAVQAERDALLRWRHGRTIRVSGGRDAIWHEAWSQTPADAPAWWHWADASCEECGFLAANPLPKEEGDA